MNFIFSNYLDIFTYQFEFYKKLKDDFCKVSVQGVAALGSHFAILCRKLDFYEVKKDLINVGFDYQFSKRKGKYFYPFIHS